MDHRSLRLTGSCLMLASQAAHPKAKTPHMSCGVERSPDAGGKGICDAGGCCGIVLVCMHSSVMLH